MVTDGSSMAQVMALLCMETLLADTRPVEHKLVLQVGIEGLTAHLKVLKEEFSSSSHGCTVTAWHKHPHGH